ncbi:hypothetical protein ABZ690_08880 [Streptomyces sp. NPDC006967]|uniref:hypothetical protein n=1 Tax=unclassified Streptomyces TaxID=2593676 RepID=UPI000CD5B1D1|nr:hypothetical protein [Streptomyces sp. SM1]
MTPQDVVRRMVPPFAGWLALAALALPGGSPLRGAVVAVFLAAGPGAALVGVCGPALWARPAREPVASGDPDFARDCDRLERLMLVVFLSIGVVMIVATVLIATHTFNAQRVLLASVLLTTLAAFCPRLRASPRAPGASKTRKGSAL